MRVLAWLVIIVALAVLLTVVGWALLGEWRGRRNRP